MLMMTMKTGLGRLVGSYLVCLADDLHQRQVQGQGLRRNETRLFRHDSVVAVTGAHRGDA